MARFKNGLFVKKGHVTPPHLTSCDHVIKQSCDFAAFTISHHSGKFDGHTLCESVNVANHENYS